MSSQGSREATAADAGASAESAVSGKDLGDDLRTLGLGPLVAIGSPADRLQGNAIRGWKLAGFLVGALALLIGLWIGRSRLNGATAVTLVVVGLGVIDVLVDRAVRAIAIRNAARALGKLYQRTPAVQLLAAASSGTMVRVVGRIREGESIPTLFRAANSVLSSVSLGPAVETRGTDFSIETPAGDSVRVLVEHALLHAPSLPVDARSAATPVRWQRAKELPRIVRKSSDSVESLLRTLRRDRATEASVGPGDDVEVVGRLLFEPPALVSEHGTNLPFSWAIGGDTSRPLVVRPLKPR